MKSKKVTLTITVEEELLKDLKRLIASGEISKTINKLIKDEIKRLRKIVADQYFRESVDEITDDEMKTYLKFHKGKFILREKNEEKNPSRKE